jgi:inorganic pyrophosphatase
VLNPFNPWHFVHPGKQVPQTVTAVIEIPQGSKAKYELDKESGLLKLDRVLFSAVYYPANYGFIPQTFCEDGDPLDILVISEIDVQPLCLVEAKVIGVMRMTDQGEADDKIIAIASHDISVNYIEDIEQLPPHTIVQMQRFFEDYKSLENKKVVVEHFLGKADAYRIIEEGFELYNRNFRKS